jgi:hypothetical protein
MDYAPKILLLCNFMVYPSGGPVRAFRIERDLDPIEEAAVCLPPKKHLFPFLVDGASYPSELARKPINAPAAVKSSTIWQGQLIRQIAEESLAYHIEILSAPTSSKPDTAANSFTTEIMAFLVWGESL